MPKDRKTFAEYYGLSKVESVDERRWVETYLHAIIKSEVDFDFAPLKQNDSKLYFGPNGYQASVINEGARLEHDLIGRMYADGARSVYMYFWDPAKPLDAERIFYVPQDYDHGKFEGIFDGLHFSKFGGLVDSAGNYCFIQVMESVSFFWAPRQGFDRLIGDWHWSEYRSLLNWRERDAQDDIAHISPSREMLVEDAAINAVQEYWRETGFEPPPAPPQETLQDVVSDVFENFDPTDPKRIDSFEDSIAEYARASGTSEADVLEMLNDKLSKIEKALFRRKNEEDI